MSNIAIKGATTGTGTFTIESPATNTDRSLTLPDEAGTVLTSASTIPTSQISGSLGALNLVTSGTCADTQTLNVDNCFTSTYLNYKIHLNLNLADFTSNDQDLDFYIRFRSGGSTISTANSYHFSNGYKNLGQNQSFDFGSSNASSSIRLIDNIDSGGTHAVGWVDIYAPASTDGTGKTFVLSELWTNDGGYNKIMWCQGVYNVDAAVDGFALSTFNGNGNFDGTYQIYGYGL